MSGFSREVSSRFNTIYLPIKDFSHSLGRKVLFMETVRGLLADIRELPECSRYLLFPT